MVPLVLAIVELTASVPLFTWAMRSLPTALLVEVIVPPVIVAVASVPGLARMPPVATVSVVSAFWVIA